MNPAQPYAAIPVDAAANIGHHYRKSAVVILAQDHEHGKTHFTTWGREAKDKLEAAQLADAMARILASPGAWTIYEDFRLDAGKVKARFDTLYAASREFLEWLALNPDVEGVLRAAGAPLGKLLEESQAPPTRPPLNPATVCPGHNSPHNANPSKYTGPKCCDRAGEYNGFGSDGPTLFTCPKHCSCHD